jgi:predicted lipid-binding transport protein (Tim44 family)
VRNLTRGRGGFQGMTRRRMKPRPHDARTNRQTSSGDRTMLRTIFMIGLFAIGGLFVLKIAFGLFGFALGLFGVLLGLAIRVVIIGGLIYLAIRIFSPDTARRLRQKWSGSSY